MDMDRQVKLNNKIEVRKYLNIRMHELPLPFVDETCCFEGVSFSLLRQTSCNNVAPVTNLCLGRATTRSHSSQWSQKKVAVET